MPQDVVSTAPIVEADDGFTLRLGRKPDAVIAEARMCADALVEAVRKNGWVQKYGSREHLFFEAWSFLSTMYRVTPRIRETRLVQIGDVMGYEAFAEAFHVPSGIVISTAESMCLNDEPNWDRRPQYEWQNQKKVQVGDVQVPLFQLRSMAQTRAMAKALKAPFSWIVAMAGYAPAPAEEINYREPDAGDDQPIQPPKPKPPQSATGKISAKQASRIWALGYSQAIDKKVILQILNQHGFDRADEVTVEKYEEICATIENAGAGSAQ